MRTRDYNTRFTVVMGVGKGGRRLAENIKSMLLRRWVLLSFVSEKAHDADAQILGGLDELYRMISVNEAKVAYILVLMNSHNLIPGMLENLANSTV